MSRKIEKYILEKHGVRIEVHDEKRLSLHVERDGDRRRIWFTKRKKKGPKKIRPRA